MYSFLNQTGQLVLTDTATEFKIAGHTVCTYPLHVRGGIKLNLIGLPCDGRLPPTNPFASVKGLDVVDYTTKATTRDIEDVIVENLICITSAHFEAVFNRGLKGWTTINWRRCHLDAWTWKRNPPVTGTPLMNPDGTHILVPSYGVMVEGGIHKFYDCTVGSRVQVNLYNQAVEIWHDGCVPAINVTDKVGKGRTTVPGGLLPNVPVTPPKPPVPVATKTDVTGLTVLYDHASNASGGAILIAEDGFAYRAAGDAIPDGAILHRKSGDDRYTKDPAGTVVFKLAGTVVKMRKV